MFSVFPSPLQIWMAGLFGNLVLTPPQIGLGLTTLLEEKPPPIDHTIVSSITIKLNIWLFKPYVIRLHG